MGTEHVFPEYIVKNPQAGRSIVKGDRTDDHLARMLTRAMMCFATARAEERGMMVEQKTGITV